MAATDAGHSDCGGSPAPCDHGVCPDRLSRCIGHSAPDTRAADLGADVVALGLRSGLTAIGIADAEVFEETLAVLHARKRRGLHADMQFTYRNPERSTDPGRILPGARSLVVGAWSYRHQEPQPVALPSVRTDVSAVPGRPHLSTPRP